jgi:hypothetical protein
MREFKIDITLAAELAQFLEGILEAEFNEEFDSEEPCTDTYLDQFMPNGLVPNAELIAAIKAAGIVREVPEQTCAHLQTYEAVRHAGGMAIYKCTSCNKVV